MKRAAADRPPSQYALLRARRFAPFFWTQFAGAFNDNVFKNAFVVFVTFGSARAAGLDAGTIVNLIGAVFILPFLLFSATSGQIADKYEKARLIRLVKLLEIAIAIVGLAGFATASVPLLFAALALLGVHSTLFGPIKYAILPQCLATRELTGGNGLVEAGTFIAILLGTIAGGIVVAIEGAGPLAAGALTLAVAVAGWLASRAIPPTPRAAPDLVVNWNAFSETWRNLAIARENRVVWRSMLAISWFWFYGAIYLAQLPAFTQHVLHGNAHVFTLLLALFSIGIGIGSLLCERLSAHEVEPGLVPFGALGLTVFAVDLWLATRVPTGGAPMGAAAFVAAPLHWRIGADIVLLGIFGGFYTVPLYALIQARSPASHRSRIIAANNILNALFIVASAGVAIGLLGAGLSVPELFLAVGVMNALVIAYLCLSVPEFPVRARALLRRRRHRNAPATIHGEG
jgi:MFS family permease